MLPVILLSASATAAQPFSPLRVFVDCQSGARVDACTFLTRAVDSHPALIRVPRSDDQVTVQLNVTTVGLIDRVNLTYRSQIPGAPELWERTIEVDSRAAVDEQVAIIDAALMQGLAVYMALISPEAVTVTISVPDSAHETATDSGTPWGYGLYAGTWGSWTENYQYF